MNPNHLKDIIRQWTISVASYITSSGKAEISRVLSFKIGKSWSLNAKHLESLETIRKISDQIIQITKFLFHLLAHSYPPPVKTTSLVCDARILLLYSSFRKLAIQNLALVMAFVVDLGSKVKHQVQLHQESSYEERYSSTTKVEVVRLLAYILKLVLLAPNFLNLSVGKYPPQEPCPRRRSNEYRAVLAFIQTENLYLWSNTYYPTLVGS